MNKKLFDYTTLCLTTIATVTFSYNSLAATQTVKQLDSFPINNQNSLETTIKSIEQQNTSPQIIAKKNYTYEIYLTGIACYKESKHVWGAKSDEPFVVVAAYDDRGNITERVLPAPNRYFQKMDQGDMLRLNYRVWTGGVQNVELSAQVWDFDSAERKAVKTLTHISDVAAAIGAAAISAASLGTAAVGAAGGAAVIAKFNEKTRESLEGALHDHLGTTNKRVELSRVGRLADAPQLKMGPIRYDFHTDHYGDRGHYKLFWEVRRY